MVIVKQKMLVCFQSLLPHLHSNMVIVKLDENGNTYVSIIDLHSNMVIVKLKRM